MVKYTVESKDVTTNLDTLKGKLGNQIASGLWIKITRWLKLIVKKIFGGQSIYGVEAWPRISPTLYGHIRYSSSGNQVGRYSSSSRPNIASGAYFKSFQQIASTASTMRYGSTHPIAHLIESGGWNRKSGYRPRRPLPYPNYPLFVQDINRVATNHVNTIIREVFK